MVLTYPSYMAYDTPSIFVLRASAEGLKNTADNRNKDVLVPDHMPVQLYYLPLPQHFYRAASQAVELPRALYLCYLLLNASKLLS